MIREVIVVEGRDDISAVKSAVEAEVIATHGFGYNRNFIRDLKKMGERRGIIIFTDPDFVGDRIREDIDKNIPNCKHAFLPQSKSYRNGDVGIENASVEDIRKALEKAKPGRRKLSEDYGMKDLMDHGLVGRDDSRDRRDRLGDILGIGYGNGKQFLSRLNSFAISRSEFLKGIEEIEDE